MNGNDNDDLSHRKPRYLYVIEGLGAIRAQVHNFIFSL